MLRALPRAVPSLRTMRSTPLRSSFRTPAGPTSACIVEKRSQQARLASTTHAISNPTLADIEKRWEGLPPQEQADLWMALRDRMKIDWHDLTLQERKAGMYSVGFFECFVLHQGAADGRPFYSIPQIVYYFELYNFIKAH